MLASPVGHLGANGSGNGAPVNSNGDPNPCGHIVRTREAGADADGRIWIQTDVSISS